MKTILPFLILLIAASLTTLLVIFKPDAAEVAPERPVTRVETIEVQPQDVRLMVKSQGTVLPTSETDLIAEVNGRVIEVGENFRVGNRFRQGDVLLIIDPADYRAELALRASELASAKLALAQEEASAEQAAADWDALGEGEASDLTLRKPQLVQARARVASAEAALEKAQRDLERTRLTAPYDGIVLHKEVDLGQYITANPANPLGRIYSTQSAEVRLPITTKEAALLDPDATPQASVFLKQFGNASESVWQAPLVRIEENIDPGSRLLYAVARIQNSFEESGNQAVLRRGTFLGAEIEGRKLTEAYVLPRYALRGSDTVYAEKYKIKIRKQLAPTIDPYLKATAPIYTLIAKTFDQFINRLNSVPYLKLLNHFNQRILETRTVTIVKSDAEEVIITEGLNPGERVAISPIAYFVENMPVEVLE